MSKLNSRLSKEMQIKIIGYYALGTDPKYVAKWLNTTTRTVSRLYTNIQSLIPEYIQKQHAKNFNSHKYKRLTPDFFALYLDDLYVSENAIPIATITAYKNKYGRKERHFCTEPIPNKYSKNEWCINDLPMKKLKKETHFTVLTPVHALICLTQEGKMKAANATASTRLMPSDYLVYHPLPRPLLSPGIKIMNDLPDFKVSLDTYVENMDGIPIKSFSDHIAIHEFHYQFSASQKKRSLELVKFCDLY